jgi:adenosylmethionine-8-amino-7-oxononanoate aminotransferase
MNEAQARERYFELSERLIEEHKATVCAFIVEPIIQGAAGMIVHPPGYLKHIRELTRRHGILLIADEVAVGFGRTGRMFACEWEDVAPDLICLGKGLTGGYLPLAATLATEQIFSAFLGDYSELKTFFHGHTYTGNPLACAAALASLETFAKEKTLAPEIFRPKAAQYAEGMARLAEMPQVGSVRFRGLMGGVELVADKRTGEPFPFAERVGHRVCMTCRKHGVILRPLGDVLVLIPPLAVTKEELAILFSATEKAIAEILA